MNVSSHRLGYAAALLVLAMYGYLAVRAPQSYHALVEKRQKVRTLQEDNADLRHQNEKRRERIHKLGSDKAEQEMEIRRRLHLLHPNETQFILPNPPKSQ